MLEWWSRSGVSAPVPHGVGGCEASCVLPLPAVGPYMPKSVEDVRFRIERVRETSARLLALDGSRWESSVGLEPMYGEDCTELSFEEENSKGRRGRGFKRGV